MASRAISGSRVVNPFGNPVTQPPTTQTTQPPTHTIHDVLRPRSRSRSRSRTLGSRLTDIIPCTTQHRFYTPSWHKEDLRRLAKMLGFRRMLSWTKPELCAAIDSKRNHPKFAMAMKEAMDMRHKYGKRAREVRYCERHATMAACDRVGSVCKWERGRCDHRYSGPARDAMDDLAFYKLIMQDLRKPKPVRKRRPFETSLRSRSKSRHRSRSKSKSRPRSRFGSRPRSRSRSRSPSGGASSRPSPPERQAVESETPAVGMRFLSLLGTLLPGRKKEDVTTGESKTRRFTREEAVEIATGVKNFKGQLTPDQEVYVKELMSGVRHPETFVEPPQVTKAVDEMMAELKRKRLGK